MIAAVSAILSFSSYFLDAAVSAFKLITVLMLSSVSDAIDDAET